MLIRSTEGGHLCPTCSYYRKCCFRVEDQHIKEKVHQTFLIFVIYFFDGSGGLC